MRALFGLIVFFAVAWMLPSVAEAQVNRVPSCTFALRANCGVLPNFDTLYRLTDGLAANDCSAGGGTNEMLCFCEGTTCVVAVDDSGSGAIPGTTSDFNIQNNAPSLQWTDTNTDDNDISAAADIDCTATGTGAEECDIDIHQQKGGAAATAFFSDADGTIMLGNFTDPPTGIDLTADPIISKTGSPALEFTDRDTDDNDVNVQILTNCTTTGTGAEDCNVDWGVQVGGTLTTKFAIDADGPVNVTPESQFNVINNASGTVSLALRDYADTDDDDMAHSQIVTNCTDTGTGAEDCDMALQLTVAGAPPATVVNLDADGNVEINRDTSITSGGNVEVLLTDSDTDDDDVSGQLNLNCTDTGTGAEDCDLGLIQQVAGANVTRLNMDADDEVTVTANETELDGLATGNTALIFKDFDASDDDDNVQMLVNCTATGSGAEECDFTLSQQKGGSMEDILVADADGTLLIGDQTDPPTVIIIASDAQLMSGTNADLNIVDTDTDDNDVSARIRTNCTATGTGAEDCDVSIMQQKAGAEITLANFDADGNVTLGSEDNTVIIAIQNGAAPGATCDIGEIFIDTDESDDTNCTTTADNSLCICTAADTWTALENN